MSFFLANAAPIMREHFHFQSIKKVKWSHPYNMNYKKFSNNSLVSFEFCSLLVFFFQISKIIYFLKDFFHLLIHFQSECHSRSMIWKLLNFFFKKIRDNEYEKPTLNYLNTLLEGRRIFYELNLLEINCNPLYYWYVLKSWHFILMHLNKYVHFDCY